MNEFLFAMILTELEDAVGKKNCSTRAIDKATHSVDYYWLSRMWADRDERMPEADIIVCPKDAQEVSKVLKIANYYKIPVTTWVEDGEYPNDENALETIIKDISYNNAQKYFNI